MFLVSIPVKLFIIGVIVILLIFLGILVYKNEIKKRKVFITQIVYNLMKEKMENVEHNSNSLYDISFKYNNRNFFIKTYKGGSKKGFIMTNPTTIHETTYSSVNGPSKSSEHLHKLTPFLVEPLEGIKIILVKDNLLRITKYINENEIEEVKYNVPAFNTYIVQEKDFSKFIELIKNPKKK